MKEKILKIISFIALPLFLLLCIVTVEYLNYRDIGKMSERWGISPGAFAFELLLTALVSAVLLLLVKKVWIYAVSFGSVTVIMGLINCVKHAVNGDYFFPWDVTMLGSTGQLLGFARFDIPPLFWMFLALIAGFCVFFAFAKAEIQLKWYYRAPPAAVVLLTFAVMFQFPDAVNCVFKAFGMSFNDSILQSSNYYANGFVNAFTINCFALKVRSPDGYGKEQIEGYLKDCEKTEAVASPDVIVILSEAYFDVTTLANTTFSRDPQPVLHSLADNEKAYVGTVMTSALGGGTVRTEFEILTGLTVDYLTNGTSPYIYVTKPLETYVSNYKEQGYSATALHTYYRDFYMRSSAYPFLGFDEFLGEDEILKRADATWRRSYLTDATLVAQIKDTLEEKSDAPAFVFGITMENHQGYGKTPDDEIVVGVQNDRLDGDMLDSVTTYTQGAYYADAALGELIDYVEHRDKPTILLFFGDHLPALGSNQLAFRQAGNVEDTDDYEYGDRFFLFGTPFVFYNNFGADYESVLKGNRVVSSYYLLTLTAELSGTAKTEYMSYLAKNFDETPFYNRRLGNDLSDGGKAFINSMRLITYDRLRGNSYSVK